MNEYDEGWLHKLYNSTLVYIIFPSAPLLLISYLLDFSVFLLIGIIISSVTLEPIYKFLSISTDCTSCFEGLPNLLQDFKYIVFMEMAPIYFMLYFVWDIKRNNICLSYNVYKLKQSKIYNDISGIMEAMQKAVHYSEFLYFCLIQIVRSTVKKAVLGMILPIIFIILSGYPKFPAPVNYLTGLYERGGNSAGSEIIDVVFGNLKTDRNKASNTKSKFSHLVGAASDDELRVLRRDISCGYSSENNYFSNTMYLDVDQEAYKAYGGRFFRATLAVAKHPCKYSQNAPVFQCKIPLEKRKYQYVSVSILNKSKKIIKRIKLKREDK